MDVLQVEYLLAIAVVTLMLSLVALIQSHQCLHVQRLSVVSGTFAGLAITLYGAWIGENIILYHRLQAPKPNLMR